MYPSRPMTLEPLRAISWLCGTMPTRRSALLPCGSCRHRGLLTSTRSTSHRHEVGSGDRALWSATASSSPRLQLDRQASAYIPPLFADHAVTPQDRYSPSCLFASRFFSMASKIDTSFCIAPPSGPLTSCFCTSDQRICVFVHQIAEAVSPATAF